MTRPLSKIRATSLPRRGLSREEAAVYLGISPGTFDQLRHAGQIDAPRVIGGRKLWDIRDLDMAFDSLPREDVPGVGSSWDDA
jgi:excisionase family DNA binding protein